MLRLGVMAALLQMREAKTKTLFMMTELAEAGARVEVGLSGLRAHRISTRLVSDVIPVMDCMFVYPEIHTFSS